jgi:predicted HTH transcriptional regulator
MKIFKEAGLPEPNIAEFQNGLLVTLHKNVTENVTENRLNKILKLIRENPEITTENLSTKLDVAKRTILRDIGKLKTKGMLKYIGPSKGGFWEVLEQD